MSIATVADSLNRTKDGELKVLWFDAHPDINTYKSSPSKNFHGMPLSYLTGLDNNDDFSFIINKLPIQNIMYIGIRDINKYEQKIINKHDMWYLTSDEINDDHKYSYDLIKSFIGNDPFHLSFDVDCLDPSIISSTGTPVKNGLELEQTKYIIDKLLDKPNLINMDITELNLDIGTEYQQLSSLDNFLYLFDKEFEEKDNLNNNDDSI
jgi:arginase